MSTEIKLFEYEFIVRESHLDTFGHVNNATYLTLYEEARWEMIESNGWGLKRIQKEKRGPVITNINISYRREITLREKIKVQTKFKDFINSKICRFEQVMYGQEGKVRSSVIIEAGLFDLENRKLLAPDNEWMESIGVTGDWQGLIPQ